MRFHGFILSFLTVLFVVSSCGRGGSHVGEGLSASFFSVDTSGCATVVRTVSPFDGKVDSVILDKPVSKVVCMSTTCVAAFCEVGAAGLVAGVSGKRYLSNPSLACDPSVADVGFDGAIDYEAIVRMDPDLVLAYAVSSVEPSYVQRLNSMGVRTLVLYDNFEQHPLARAEYVKVAGALAGRMDVADSIFGTVRDSYLSMVRPALVARVLINVPFGDAWYVPSRESYMYRLISDAGGELLGAGDGPVSSTITVEKAYSLASEADFWLNPGHVRGLDELRSLHPSFSAFLHDGMRVYNNTLRMNPEGGNDFYERGAVRPDLVLSDLVAIFSGSEDASLEYYLEVE